MESRYAAIVACEGGATPQIMTLAMNPIMSLELPPLSKNDSQFSASVPGFPILKGVPFKVPLDAAPSAVIINDSHVSGVTVTPGSILAKPAPNLIPGKTT